MTRVQVRGELLRWARERAGITTDVLESRFPRLELWERGEAQPTLKQLEAYAKVTSAPIGYFFLEAPPDEAVPIPDFRTLAGVRLTRPSPNLLETVYACQDRRDWFREYARSTGQEPLGFVGSVTIRGRIVETATAMRNALGFDLDARQTCPTWTDALRMFIGQADRVGVLVMCSGVVMSNNRRRLDPAEFRGFALADELAPLVFINGADSKSAQMFTLAHELAHIWLGQTALSDATVASEAPNDIETWCNRVAAELLAPLEVVRAELRPHEQLDATLGRLARRFKVSSLVVLQRLRDSGRLTRDAFRTAYEAEVRRIANLPRRDNGGDFYLTTAARCSRRFVRALVESTLEGRTLYRDAFRLVGVTKTETFLELGRSLNIET
jgi:Zn-dependent peptidase ImmA (M78 family)/transcriptional regulator with XRE-family HTH domain